VVSRVRGGFLVRIRLAPVLAMVFAGLAWSGLSGASATNGESAPSRKAVVYVMPSALDSPGSGEGSSVVVDSAHNGREPQVAKIYQELQHNKGCQPFSANMVKAKADYFLLLQHGGGRGNRWAVSNKAGNVIASGESFRIGTAVSDACLAMAKDWKSLQPPAAR